MIKITHNGRPFDAKRFTEEIQVKALEMGMEAIEEKARGAASSIIDPETGRHADVFVDRLPENRVTIRTRGSPAFARLLEKRLGVNAGEVETSVVSPGVAAPRVYLAHATEDKSVVRPVAEFLMANGVEVWFDEWDIEAGQSLRQAMEDGLGWMTHFVVILTPTSIKKRWVSREIDVGITRLVGGDSRMVPLRVGVEPGELPLFLQTLLCPAFDPVSGHDLKNLIDRLHGVSRKPALGPKPSYVQSVSDGLTGWSSSAIAIAKHLVETSEHGLSHDPMRTPAELADATGLSAEDVKIGSLDLRDAGLLKQSEYGDDSIWPARGLFVDFDAAYMGFDPAADGLVIANRLVSVGDDLDIEPLATELGWAPRRMNSAVAYLERVGAIDARHSLASEPWRAVYLSPIDQTLRFVRSHA
jgi:hypothetical protein